MAQDGDIVFMIGADVAGLTRAGQAGEQSLADMEKAAKTLERQIAKIGEAGVQFQREMNKLTGVTTEFSKSARDSAAAFEAFDKARAQVDNLRASIDPLFAASKRYEAALHQLDSALEMGAISAREHASMMDGLAAAYLRADNAADMAAMGMRGMGGGLQNVGFQIQDFAVQVGAGTSATQAFAQQFPQLAMSFGKWGAIIGTAAAVMIPLGIAFLSASEQASAFTKAMDDLATSTATAKDELFMLQTGLDTMEQVKLARELGALVAEQTRLREEAVQAEGVVAQYMIDQANALQLQINAAREKLAADKAIRAELAAAREAQKARVQMQQTMNDLSRQFQAIMNTIGNTDISSPWQAVTGWIDAALSKAREFAQASMVYSGRGGDPRQFGANAGQSNTFGVDNFAVPDGASGGGGGGGGANPIQTQLEALRQQMMTEEQIEMESYAKRQEMLAAALEQQLVTQQEYAALMQGVNEQHQGKMAEIDVMRYGTVLDQANAFMGGMATILQQGGQKQQRIAAIFGAAQALISTYQGAAKELQKGTLGFAGAAAVIAKGMGFVGAIKSAGKTGGGVSASASAGGSGGATEAAAPIQTMNFTISNDPFGFGERIVRQLVTQLNEAQRNGSSIRGTIGSA